MSVFNFGFKNPFANGADSSEIQPFPDENRGLGIAFDQTEGKPEMKGLNGLFNKITQSLLSIRQNGLLGWVNDLEYIQGGFVVESGKLYQAKRNNTNKQPSLSQNDWELWSNSANITVDSNGNIIKTNNTNGSFSLKVEGATTSKKGVSKFASAYEVINNVSDLVATTPKNVSDIAQSTDFGVGQSWQNVTSSRSSGVAYINNTSKPITVTLTIRDRNKSAPFTVHVNSVLIIDVDDFYEGAFPITFIVPPSSIYIVTTGNTIRNWSELR